MRKSLLPMTILGLVLTGAGCGHWLTTSYVITNQSSGGFISAANQNVSQDASIDSLEILVTPDGVRPANLTVRSGTTVVFKNTDLIVHQVSSDPHPAHTDLPGFDGVIAPGRTYSFTFFEVGSWGFHDHLDATNQKFIGRVIVQP